ncbi:hypothetical protein ScPMuIL_009601 [Solemya velum]
MSRSIQKRIVFNTEVLFPIALHNRKLNLINIAITIFLAGRKTNGITSMAQMLMLFLVTLLGKIHPGRTGESDPCLSGDTNEVPYMIGRSTNCPNTIKSFCDDNLSDGWYRVSSERPMVTSCPDINSCGAVFPLWMNGTIPRVADGIVPQTACLRYFDDCCHTELPIRVKNCSDSLVYHLVTAGSCPLQYCFGTDGICEEPTPGPDTNPCLAENHQDLPYVIGRSTKCPYSPRSFSDYHLVDGWYRVNNSSPMPTECVKFYQCGLAFPGWMNGTTPVETDGIVSHNICISSFEDCCVQSLPVQVKNCSDFLVYNLVTAPFPQVQYCFGTDDICQEKPSTIQTTTPYAEDPCLATQHNAMPYLMGRSINCPHTRDSFCDDYLLDGWYRVESTSPMPTQCVGINSCGTMFPIWMNGTMPLQTEGIVVGTACINIGRSCCGQSLPIKVKNCGSFHVYHLPRTHSCPTKYCFGTNGPCLETTSAPPIMMTTSENEDKQMGCQCPVSDEGIAVIVTLLVLFSIVVGVMGFFFGKRYHKVADKYQASRSLQNLKLS